MKLLKLCTALLFAVSFAEALMIFYPLMCEGRVIGYEPNLGVRVAEFSLCIVFMLLATVTLVVTMGRKGNNE